MKHKKRQTAPYCERIQYGPERPVNHICLSCNFVFKGNSSKCARCGSEKVDFIGSVGRVPKKNASKRKWKEFWKSGFKAHPENCR